MRASNIKSVRRLEFDGITYAWFVASKEPFRTPSREYIHYENGRTCVKSYPFEMLPKYVKDYITRHNGETLIYTEPTDDRYKHYLIK